MSARSIRRTHQREIERDERRRGRRAGRVAIATGAALGAGALLVPAGAQAVNFPVVTAGDAGDNTCDATCTLRDAVDDANATAAADTITFAPAITGEIQLLDGEIEITEPLSIQGPGAGTLAVSGDRDGDDQVDFKHTGEPGDSRIFDIDPPYAPPPNETAVSISGLTLREGVAGDYAYSDYYAEDGGAIISRNADLTLTNMVLTDNVASDEGGALRHYGESLTVRSSTISDNTSYDDGGGIRGSSYGYGDEPNLIRIVDTTVTGNRAGVAVTPFDITGGENGGGLDINGEFEIAGATISGNSARVLYDGELGGDGGGASFYGDGTVRNSTIINNTAGDTGGGALVGRTTIESTTIAGNSAADAGGGVNLKYGGVLRSSTISGNQAPRGGGVVASASSRIFNSTVSGNRATAGEAPAGLGGGVYVYAIDGRQLAIRAAANPLVVRNSTIAANSAVANGGGIFADSEEAPSEPSVQLKSSIVADNSAPGNGDDVAQSHANVVSASFSLVEAPSPAAILGDPPGSSVFGVDPGLGALAANGGATRTHALSGTSAALDAGQAYGETRDQRGQARNVDAASSNPSFGDGTDMGAFEVQDATATGDDPDTEITKQPKDTVKTKKKKGKKVKFKFTGSDETDSAAALVFECKVDDVPFDTCVSPFKIRLKKGEHTFAVQAIDTDGNVDPTAAEAAVEVKKKKKKKA